MVIHYQSQEGHTTLTDLSDEQVREMFTILTVQGFRPFASTSLAEPVGPVKSIDEAEAMGAEELHFIAPMTGG